MVILAAEREAGLHEGQNIEEESQKFPSKQILF